MKHNKASRRLKSVRLRSYNKSLITSEIVHYLYAHIPYYEEPESDLCDYDERWIVGYENYEIIKLYLDSNMKMHYHRISTNQ